METKEFQYQDSSLMSGEKVDSLPHNAKKREKWSNKIDFLVACVGGSVGLGNVWRFPYLCYKNGGGAFLIPYFTCMLFGSLPLFILEVTVGQFMSASGAQAWKMVPLFQGIGMTVTITIFIVNCYYVVILAWTFMYLFHSFASQLPWDSCDGWWNTDNCTTNFTSSLSQGNSNFTNLTSKSGIDPVVEFWERKVLGLSSGITDQGTVKWDLALCLLLSWTLVYLCICKGIRASGKVMYFTALAPYVLMIVILVRNSMLPAASDGVSYYLKPNLTRLTDTEVWVDAGKQTFFSSALAEGIIITLGSYNKFNHNALRDSAAFAFVNAFTSILSGFLVFTILGFMASQQGRPISEVAESGPGLVFIAYPKAVAQMPLSQLWSALFFFMILLLGLDSAFVGVEAVTTAVVDEFPATLRRGYRKEIFTAFLCIVMLLVGLALITNGGVYTFQIFDFYPVGQVLIVVGFLEVIAISWCYGVGRFRDNLEMMVGRQWTKWMYPYLAVCWTVLTPLMCFVLFLIGIINFQPLTYSRPSESVYHYPAWTVGMGWLMTAFVIIWIPGIAFVLFAKYGFTMDTLRRSIVPFKLKRHQKRPQDEGERCLGDVPRVTSNPKFEISSTV